MHRGDPCGVPLCTYEHPVGVLIPHPFGVWYTNPEGLVYATLHKPFGVCVPDPVGVRLRYVFLFVVARSAFGFPAPLPPFGWYRTPLGSGNTTPLRGVVYQPRRGWYTLRLMCAHACTCVRVRKILATLTAN